MLSSAIPVIEGIGAPALAGLHPPGQVGNRRESVKAAPLGEINELAHLFSIGMTKAAAAILVLQLVKSVMRTSPHADRKRNT